MNAKTRVLVVDDEVAILRFLKPALEANSYETISSGTVAEAVKRIAAETPDIVLLDLGLADGDGKDVIRRVRNGRMCRSSSFRHGSAKQRRSTLSTLGLMTM
jgi:two-component system KDP operon response regulator KdpE